jgi:hypothetical protein
MERFLDSLETPGILPAMRTRFPGPKSEALRAQMGQVTEPSGRMLSGGTFVQALRSRYRSRLRSLCLVTTSDLEATISWMPTGTRTSTV